MQPQSIKRKRMIPKTVSQHIKEELRENPEFRKSYHEEVAKLTRNKEFWLGNQNSGKADSHHKDQAMKY
jgi:hypothetical protein